MRMKNRWKHIYGIALVLTLSVLIPFCFATVTIPTTSSLALPLYGTLINFSTQQVFDSAYRTADNNASYPSFWFLTNGTSIFGLQAESTSLLVTSLSYSSWINYTKSVAGTEKIYVQSAPLFGYINGAKTTTGWTYSGNVITVTGATTSASFTFAATTITYTVSLTHSPISPFQGDLVTIQIAIMGSDGYPLTSYKANVTKDGSLFLSNLVDPSFTDIEANPQAHFYNISGLTDSSNNSLSFTSPDLTVNWAQKGSSGSNPTPTPSITPIPSQTPIGNATPTPSLTPIGFNLPFKLSDAIIVLCIIIISAVIVLVLSQNNQKGMKKSNGNFSNRKHPKNPFATLYYCTRNNSIVGLVSIQSNLI